MSRTLEEILAYSRETGMDWELTAEEAGLLRREVERLRDQLTSERERVAKADALMLERMHEQVARTDAAVREEREAVAAYLRRVGEYGFEDIAQRIERGEHRR